MPLYASGIYGVIILVVMLFRPEGLIPSRRAPPSCTRACTTSRSTTRRTPEQRHERRDRNGDYVLVATGVRKEFGGLVAVNDVDFTVPRGKVISLIGPNGAGKTTFFNMLTGVYKPTAGKVMFLGEDVTGKPPHAITARGIGRTFQNIRLFQNMTRARERDGRHALAA